MSKSSVNLSSLLVAGAKVVDPTSHGATTKGAGARWSPEQIIAFATASWGRKTGTDEDKKFSGVASDVNRILGEDRRIEILRESGLGGKFFTGANVRGLVQR